MRDIDPGVFFLVAFLSLFLLIGLGLALDHKEDMLHVKKGHCYHKLIGSGSGEWGICK